jgi:hypothetical protein
VKGDGLLIRDPRRERRGGGFFLERSDELECTWG